MSAQSSLASLARLPSQDPAFYAREYNNRALVPDNAEHMARWAAQSAVVRARSEFLPDLSYAEPGSPNEADQQLDYFPGTGERPSLLVFVHGGYYRALDKRDHSFVASELPARGVSVAVVNYSLCPSVSVRTIVLQVVRSVAWLYRQADRLGHDPARIFVAGHSVGGHLAAMLMTTLWPQLGDDLPADLVKGGLSISGLYDLEPLRLAEFLQVDLMLSEEDVASMSPAYLPPATNAPLVTAVGELESAEYHRQHALIRAAWPANAAEAVPLPGKHHFNAMDDLAWPDSPLLRAVLSLTGAAG